MIGDQKIHKLIPLQIAERNGCSGATDFGSLTNAVKELGPQLGLIVFLLMRQ